MAKDPSGKAKTGKAKTATAKTGKPKTGTAKTGTAKTGKKADEAEASAPQPRVVSDRRVVTRPLKRGEVRNQAANLEAENPNAPKPIPTNEYRPRLVQIKRRHKTDGPMRTPPSGMSDIKI